MSWHPLVEWLTSVYEHRSRTEIPEKILRIAAEKVLLARHESDASGTWCRNDGEAWPCFEWRVIGAGWAHVPGYRNEWRPSEHRHVLDLDVLLGELDR